MWQSYDNLPCHPLNDLCFTMSFTGPGSCLSFTSATAKCCCLSLSFCLLTALTVPGFCSLLFLFVLLHLWSSLLSHLFLAFPLFQLQKKDLMIHLILHYSIWNTLFAQSSWNSKGLFLLNAIECRHIPVFVSRSPVEAESENPSIHICLAGTHPPWRRLLSWK